VNLDLLTGKLIMKYLLALCLSVLSSLSVAQAPGDVDALLSALAPITRLQGSFTQMQYGQDNSLLAESGGQFRLLRPGYFAWEIQRPDEQLVIAGPEFIWHFDRDLETVTRRPITTDADMTPLQILGGDETALREKFQVERSAPGTFVLTPLASGVGFRQLTLRLENDQLAGMEIQDNLDQRVVITFSELDSESDLGAVDFAFTPPPGADLFYYDE
jgi:outer membrane lipoprotein carrier protein